MRQGVGNAISIMGARPTSNNFMIDGTANIDTSLGTPAAILSVDAIQEFKEQTTTYSAEYRLQLQPDQHRQQVGHERLPRHGLRLLPERRLDARNFFDNKSSPAPEARSEAVRVLRRRPRAPAVYDGRNRTFFLVNYEGARIERGATNFYTVPTPDQLAGHFSTPIIDPPTGQPFPNNTIPQSRFSRLAQLALRSGWFPAPNTERGAGQLPGWCARCRRTQDQFTIRGDQDLGKLRPGVLSLSPRRCTRTRTTSNLHGYRQPRVRAGHDATGRSHTRWPSAATS